jgi:hypothetical protein
LYNAEIKEQYLSTRQPDVRVRHTQIFNQVSDLIEQPHHKDVTEASLDELRCGFTRFESIDVHAMGTILSAVRSYNRWAHSTSQPFTFTDALEVFDERTDVDYTVGIRKYILPSPEALVSAVTRLYPIDEGYEVLPALIFAWLGVSSADCIRLKSDAVDFERRLFTLPDGTICPNEIPEAFIEPLRAYSKTRTATRFSQVEYPVFADDLGFFMKKMLPRSSKKQGKPYTQKQISDNITDFCYRCEEQLHIRPTFNYTTITKSGVFYRLYQYELSGADLYAKENKDKVLSIANKKSFKDVMTVYEAYRAVFYPRS